MRVVGDRFTWLTGSVVLAFLLAVALVPPTADARRIARVGGAEAERLLQDARSPLVLVFTSRACGICRAAVKILRRVAREGPADVRYAEVEMGAAEALADRLAVGAVPTELVFVRGTLVHRTSAIESVEELQRALGAPGSYTYPK